MNQYDTPCLMLLLSYRALPLGSICHYSSSLSLFCKSVGSPDVLTIKGQLLLFVLS